MSEIFVHLNEMNQAEDWTGRTKILCSMAKIQGFHTGLKLWLQHIANRSTKMFPTVCSLAAGNKLLCVNKEHLNALQQTFLDYSKRVWNILTGFIIHLVFLQHLFLQKLKTQ